MRRDFEVVTETLLKNPENPAFTGTRTETKVVTNVVTEFANELFRS